MKMARTAVLAAIVMGWWGAAPAAAQSLGTYRWQLQPFCNVLTISVVQQGGQYQLDGSEMVCLVASGPSLAAVNCRGIEKKKLPRP